MITLLRTNLFKMFHSWSFWLTLLLLPFMNFLKILDNDEYYMGLRPESGLIKWNILQCADSCFLHLTYLTYFVVLLVGILIGDEYSSGAVRNKIVAGHSRAQIYTSYLITSVSECIIVHLFCVYIAYVFCTVRYGFDGNLGTIWVLTYSSIAPVAALAAITLFCIAAAGDRIVGMIIAFVGDLAVYIFIAYFFVNRLRIEADKLSALAKKIFVICDSLIPSSYAEWFVIPMRKVMDMGIETMPSCCWCLLTLIIFCAAGIAVFKKRDIK